MNNYLLPLLFLALGCNVISTITGGKTSINDNGPPAQPIAQIADACSAGSGCDHWFDAADSSNFFADGACSTAWSSAEARCWTSKYNGTTISRPSGFTGTYASGVFNGMGAYQINGNAGQAGFLNISPSITQSWFFLLQLTTVPPGQRFVFGNGASGSTNVTGISVDGSMAVTAHYGSTTIASSSSSIAVNQPTLLTIIADGADFKFYIDGGLIGQIAIGAIDTTNDFGIGALMDGAVTNGADMYLHELVVYEYTVSDQDRMDVENFLRDKWGL